MLLRKYLRLDLSSMTSSSLAGSADTLAKASTRTALSERGNDWDILQESQRTVSRSFEFSVRHVDDSETISKQISIRVTNN
jgi:hypothetical protein